MRIAIICDPIDLDQKTWIPVYCKNLVESIIKIDKKNEYIYFHFKENKLLEWQKQVILKSNHKYWFLNAFYMLWKKFILTPYYLRKYKVDLVHELNMFHPCSFDFFRKYKTVTTMFDLTPMIFPNLHWFLNALWFNLFSKLSLKSSDKVISISDATKFDIIKYFKTNKDKIITTYLWTDILERVEDKSLNFDFPFVLSVGTLEPRKNLRLLVKAFIKLKEEKNIEEKLVLVWKKWWKIEWLFEELSLNQKYKDDVILTWFISDEQLVHLYKTCKVFVYPSLYEWFGLPVLEAMSVWTPVITSNISSLPEVVWEKWTLIDPNSIEDLSEKLYNLLINEELRKENIENWLKRAELFSWENCARETIKVYEELYKEKKKI